MSGTNPPQEKTLTGMPKKKHPGPNYPRAGIALLVLVGLAAYENGVFTPRPVARPPLAIEPVPAPKPPAALPPAPNPPSVVQAPAATVNPPAAPPQAAPVPVAPPAVVPPAVSPNGKITASVTTSTGGLTDLVISAAGQPPVVAIYGQSGAPFAIGIRNLEFSPGGSVYFTGGQTNDSRIYRLHLSAQGQPSGDPETIAKGDRFTIVPKARGQFCAGQLVRDDGGDAFSLLEPNKKTVVYSGSQADMQQFLRTTTYAKCSGMNLTPHG